MPDLSGKVAVVTGAGQGIGRATALELARCGADVVVAELRKERIAAVVAEIESLGRKALGAEVDVTKDDTVRAMAKAAEAKLGKIDILVNNAGTDVVRSLVEMSDEEWDLQIDVNLKGTFYCCRAILPGMIKRKAGAIVNIASVAGWVCYPRGVAYSAAKAGVMALTRSLAVEVSAAEGSPARERRPPPLGKARGDRPRGRVLGERRVELRDRRHAQCQRWDVHALRA
jgi:NAD(P)-dependent dehydrogenase (short-subunit alcohol dehydrogenase family)